MLECRALGVPVLLHWHGAPESPQFPGTGWRRRLFGIGVALASYVLVLAEPYRAHFERFVPAAKLVVFPNFVDGEVFRPSDAVAAEPPTLLFVGRVGPLKGVDVLLDALERARTCVPDLTATLVGAGETEEALAAVRSHSLVTSGVVRLTGPLGPERVELYRKAQIVVLPTRMDSFPMVVLEAMAAGAAVVSTTVGAIPWMLDEGACGVLLPPGDAPALAEALVALARDPARCARLGAAARLRQQGHFDARGAATVLDRLLAQAAGS
jgi:glycosyltransferase involved in cell wall biosynthesis